MYEYRLLLKHLNVAAEAFVEGDKGLGAFDPFYFLEFVVEHEAELVYVFAGDLCEHAVVTGGIVEADDLGYFLQFAGDAIIEGAFLQVNADECNDVIAKL